jgi:hypothetical protein
MVFIPAISLTRAYGRTLRASSPGGRGEEALLPFLFFRE